MDILIDIQTFKKTLSSGDPKTDTSTDNSKSNFYDHYIENGSCSNSRVPFR